MEKAKELLKKVRKIEIRTKHLVDGLLQGAYHSVFRGRGIEFSEVREYVPGDDVRSIDWNVTARMGSPFIKEFIEERDLTVYIVMDISGSGEFGSTKEKKDTAIEICASLFFDALSNNDNVGLCMFTDSVERFMPARKGKRHVLRLIRELVSYSPKSKKTDINKALCFLSGILKKRSIIFIISDFICTTDFQKPLQYLRGKNDVIAVNISDPREGKIPDIGYIELEDEETGEQLLLDTSDEDFRQRYESIVAQMSDDRRKRFSRLKIDLVKIESGEDIALPLRRFFHLREKRLIR